MGDWFPTEIESFRKANGLTRQKLSDLMGVSITCIYQWEKGLRRPSKTAKLLLTRIKEDFDEEEKKGEKRDI